MHDPEVFRKLHTDRFEADPAIYVAPGRVNLIGEHTDYAEGFVMPSTLPPWPPSLPASTE